MKTTHITTDILSTMNTNETQIAIGPKKERPFDKAIELLEALVRPGAQAILEFLFEFREGSYVDLLVHCQEGHLDGSLDGLVKAGILLQRETYSGSTYRINRIKLFRVRRAALALTMSKQNTLEILRAIEIEANL